MAVFSRGILCSLAVCLPLVESAMAEVPHSLLIGKVDKLQSRLLDGQGIKPWGDGRDERTFYELAIQRQSLNRVDINPLTCRKFVKQEYKVACQLMVLGDKFSLYDWPTYSTLYQRMQRQHADVVDAFLPPIDNVEILTRLPAFKHTAGKKEYIHQFHAVDNNFLTPFEALDVPIAINGVKSQAWFDTGAGMTLISEALAKSSHARFLPIKANMVGFYGKASAVKFAFVSELKIGDDVFNNIIVAVKGAENLLGFDIISKFKGVSLSHDRLVLNPKDAMVLKDCLAPLTLRSNLARTDQTLAAPIFLNTGYREVNIDTGSSSYLTHFISKNDYQSWTTVGANRDVMGNRGLVKFESQRMRAGVLPGHEVRVSNVVGDKNTIEKGREYILGAYLLKDYNLHVDLKKGWGCLYHAL